MDIKQFAIDHVNNHHLDALESIYRTNINEKFQSMKLVDFNLEEMILMVDDQQVKIPFTKPLNDLSEFKDAFIGMYRQASVGFDSSSVEEQLAKFINEYDSVMLGTLNNNSPVVSYAPLLKHEGKFYIYISQLAEHYTAIKQNPLGIRFMIIEDEKLAANVINRKRLTLKADTRFVEDQNEFNAVFDSFEKKVGTGGGVSMIRGMEDFVLIELKISNGRFYLGFGQVYKVDKNLKITPLNHHGGSNHNYPK